MHKRMTVVFDFDGVIHSYVSGWRGPTIIPDAPVPGIGQAIDMLRKQGYKVIVVSTRCSYEGGKEAIRQYLAEHSILVDGIQAEKPPAYCYVDDRAICFDGNTNLLPEIIKSFKPWNKKAKKDVIPKSLKSFHQFILKHNKNFDGDQLIMDSAGLATVFDLYSQGKIDELDVFNYTRDRDIPIETLYSHMYLYEAGKI